ncbi:hypothetical protein MJO28_006691, partial [Puccinia striiformis f. sp. tritici]
IIVDQEANVSIFIKYLALYMYPLMNRNQPTGVSVEELSSRESSNNLKEFAHLLWCINSEFIAAFKPKYDDYINEQLSVHQWILSLLKKVGKAKIASMPTQETEEGLTGLLRIALDSRYSLASHKVYYKLLNALSNGAVCPSQIMMTGVVINVLAYYYKSTNLKKWEALFTEDNDFVDALQKIKSWNPHRYYAAKVTKIIEQEDQRAVFPWENDSHAGSIIFTRDQRTPFFGPKGGFRTGGRIRAVKQSPEHYIAMMTDFQPTDKWLRQEAPDKLWALLSTFESFYDNFIEGPECIPQVADMTQRLEIWRSKTAGNLSDLLLSRGHAGIPQVKFRINIRRMLELIWKMNSRLIESFGYETHGDFYVTQQKELQQELFGLIALSDIPESKELYLQTPKIKNRSYVQQKIIEALNSEESRDIYRVNKRGHRVSRKGIMVTKASVEVMLTYYYKRNASKWLQVFQDEESFVLNLAQIAVRLLRKDAFVDFKAANYQPTRQLDLLPWGNHLIQLNEQNSIIRKTCVLLLWPGHVRLVRLALPLAQSRTAVPADFWTADRLSNGYANTSHHATCLLVLTRCNALREGLEVPSTDLGLTAWEQKGSDNGPVEPEPIRESQTIDFLSSWGKRSHEQSNSQKRPLSQNRDISETEEELNTYLLKGKKSKALIQSMRADDFIRKHHSEFLNIQNPDRVFQNPALSFRTEPVPVIAGASTENKDALPSSHLKKPESSHFERPKSSLKRPIVLHLSEETVRTRERPQGNRPRAFDQGNLIDLTEDSDKEVDAENPRLAKKRRHEGDHESEGSAINTGGNDMNEDQVHLKDIEPTLLAWLYSSRIGLTDSIYQEMMVDQEATISSFIKSLALHMYQLENQNQQAALSFEGLSSRQSSNNLKEFARLLWSFNSIFISKLKPDRGAYIQEQRAVHRWILNHLKQFGKATGTSMINQRTEGESLTDLLGRALTSKYSQPSHLVFYQRHIALPNVVVCPSQMMLAEAVVNVLASYYKSTNLKKWNYVFPRDKAFLDVIKRAGNPYVRVSRATKATAATRNTIRFALLPWKDDITPRPKRATSFKISSIMSGRGDISTDGRVAPVNIGRSLEMHNAMMTDFTPRDTWLVQEHPDKVWALISAVEDYDEKSIVGSSRPPDQSETVKKLKIWRFSKGDNVHPLEHAPSFQDNFGLNVQRMLDLIWKINSRLIESFGYEANTEIFLDQQRELQMEFVALLTLTDGPESKQLYSQTPDMKNGAYIQQKIMEALDCDDTHVVYKMKKRRHYTNMKDIVITKAAVEVLSTYYWRRNPSKWLQVFQEEERFVLTLAQISTKLIKKVSILDVRVRQLELLPWKNDFIQLEKHNLIIKKAFLYPYSQNMFTKIKKFKPKKKKGNFVIDDSQGRIAF